MTSPFTIYVLNADGTRRGSAPLISVTQLDDTRHLDKMGSVSFSLPASDPSADEVSPGCMFDIYDEQDGYLGRYFHKEDTLDFQNGIGTLRVVADDAFVELGRYEVGFRRNYAYTPVEDVITELVSIVPDWLAVVDAGIGNTSVTYEGESVLAAIDVLRDRWGQHMRLTGTRTLEFGAFGQASGVILTNQGGKTQIEQSSKRYMAIAERITRKRSASNIFNRIIPVGAGQGTAQLTIEGATSGVYPINSAVNYDGSTYAYVQDNDSLTSYGRRGRVVSLPSIRPISNNATDVLRARNALKLATESYIGLHTDPLVEYSISVRALRQEVKVGDTVRLNYRSSTERGAYIEVNEDFYVMDITRRRNAGGDRSATMELASIPTRRTTDVDVMADTVRDISVLKLHIQPQPFWWQKSAYDTIRADTGNSGGFGPGYNNGKRATFDLIIPNTVTYLSKVLIYIVTQPDHTTQRTTLVAPNYWNIFDIVTSENYPMGLRVRVNGTDVTATKIDQVSNKVGPWADGVNEQVTVILDITDDIKNAAGGMYQTHTVDVQCKSRWGDARLSAPDPSITTEVSLGWIHFTYSVEGVTQAILTS